jgi:hypothetical protein
LQKAATFFHRRKNGAILLVTLLKDGIAKERRYLIDPFKREVCEVEVSRDINVFGPVIDTLVSLSTAFVILGSVLQAQGHPHTTAPESSVQRELAASPGPEAVRKREYLSRGVYRREVAAFAVQSLDPVPRSKSKTTSFIALATYTKLTQNSRSLTRKYA